ncbi:winged helix-turn-helix transcriptional regulator [Aureispira anguillae]|uniref:Helix-turn-helix transcriptional regulator n=1 Tax=Aureispira anguillae TaxID=2864201 RepID=A0A915YL27_9BACT|nr:helix-turn-helix domain-containing protein [Aureispira anguillae]BDS15060.1 helix-turn-helix transcriptional regulator [Aureispira anguillae]
MKMRSHCPINYALEHIGDKWSLLIVRDLMFKGKRHYNEFFESGEKVSTSVLGDRLKKLEQSGIISKGADQVKKSRIKYSLTKKGIDMLPFMVNMIVWSSIYDANTEAEPSFLVAAKENPDHLLKTLTKKLEKEHLAD